MKRVFHICAILALVMVVGYAWFRWSAGEPSGFSEPAEEEGEEWVDEPAVAEARRVGRFAEDPDPEWLEAAREAMTDEREESCGPYLLLTDSRDGRLAGVCERIGSALDETYRVLFGILPVGEPKGAVLVFSRASAFREFASRVGHRHVGYAGFSRATRGVVALSSDGLTASEVAPTLAHELTHLVNRRALGSDLPRWLAEGLADAVGDNAGEEGLGALEGVVGVEAQCRRLLEAYGADRVGGLARLVALERSEFDRGVVSYDYEQSALLVRFLLLDRELAPELRSLLSKLALGERYEPELVTAELGVGWGPLERRFEDWLASSGCAAGSRTLHSSRSTR